MTLRGSSLTKEGKTIKRVWQDLGEVKRREKSNESENV